MVHSINPLVIGNEQHFTPPCLDPRSDPTLGRGGGSNGSCGHLVRGLRIRRRLRQGRLGSGESLVRNSLVSSRLDQGGGGGRRSSHGGLLFGGD